MILKRSVGSRSQIGALLACGMLLTSLACAGTGYAQDATSPLKPEAKANPQAKSSSLKAGKILFLGNSITLHGPAPAIGWSGNWGMAASTQEKDFVHLVIRSLSQKMTAAPHVMIKNIADFERQYATYDVDANFKEEFAFGADLVIVAIGENVPALSSEQAKTQFGGNLEKLLRGLKTSSHPRIVVRSCFWPDRAKDQILEQACEKVGGTFVDIGSLSKSQSNFARSERKFAHAGVAGHPGDRGMQAIADAILHALNSQPANGTGK